jgi:hypothetical protein
MPHTFCFLMHGDGFAVPAGLETRSTGALIYVGRLWRAAPREAPLNAPFSKTMRHWRDADAPSAYHPSQRPAGNLARKF